MADTQVKLVHRMVLQAYNLVTSENNSDSLANKSAMQANISDWSENSSDSLANSSATLAYIVALIMANMNSIGGMTGS